MVNTNQSNRVLSFHSVHGEKIRLSKQGRLAKRYDTFCQGLTFSSRSIDLDEIVVLKIAETTGRWSGVLRFGVTNVDPQTLKHSFPKYACPDMSQKGNTWAKALSERFCKQGNIINFYVRPNGEMYYGVNGVQKGLYLSSINVSEPLWVVIDIYGNTVAIEFMDPSEVPLMRQVITQPPDSGSTSPAQVTAGRNLAPAIKPCSVQPLNTQPNSAGQSNNEESSVTAVPPPPQTFSVAPSSKDFLPARPRNEEEQRAFATAQCALELNERLGRRGDIAPQALGLLPTARSSYPPLRFNNGCDVRPLEFHEICGRNVKISNDKILATRSEGEYANGYIFMKRPLKVNERIIVQILRIVPQFSGSLAFGVTSCDPIRLGGPTNCFPDDSDYLMDRSEYWVVAKDVASNPQELDELAFHVNDRGEVHLQKNASTPRIIFHVDHSQKLWLFFDVFGTTQQIRLVGGTDVKTVAFSNIVPMTGGDVRHVNLPIENQPIASQTFHNQNFGQTQPLHVQLPPSGPYSVPTTSSSITTSGFPPSFSPPRPSPPIPTRAQVFAGQSAPTANAIPPPQLSRRPLRMPPSNNLVQMPPPPPVRFSRRAPPPTTFHNQPHGSRPSVPFQGFPPPQQHSAYFQSYQQQSLNSQQHPFAQQAPIFDGPAAYQQNPRRSSPYFSPLHTFLKWTTMSSQQKHNEAYAYYLH
uniref:NHR domain-containing protein n=1 Tax=Romanomermis culicivorax TaxID=13658 RepID=A0A915JJD8_ROMCU